MPHSAVILAAGCFSLQVLSGAVAVRGAVITKTHGDVTVASSKSATCFRMAVPVRDVSVPLVIAKNRLAAASFTLTPLVADCRVIQKPAATETLAEELDCVAAWEQVWDSVNGSVSATLANVPTWL